MKKRRRLRKRLKGNAAGILGTLMVAGSFVISCLLFIHHRANPTTEIHKVFDWIDVGSMHVPFAFQIVSVCHHSAGAIAGAKAGVFSPPGGSDATYAGLQSLVAETLATLKAQTPDEINALEGKDMYFQLGERKMPFVVENFLMSFSLPNLHFHATTAYDILRQKGAPLGKRDYMGAMRLKM